MKTDRPPCLTVRSQNCLWVVHAALASSPTICFNIAVPLERVSSGTGARLPAICCSHLAGDAEDLCLSAHLPLNGFASEPVLEGS